MGVHTHTPTQTTKPITISSTYVINGFHYSIPLVILYIRSETSNWKLDLNRDSTLETKTHNGKNGARAPKTDCSEVKNYYLHGDSRITIAITDNKALKTSD